MLKCQHCNKDCKNQNSHRNHERLCPKNPLRIYKNGMQGKTPWNKGLTKETDDRVLKNAQATSSTLKGKPSKTIWTPEMRKAKSEWRKQYHLDNPEAHPNRKLAGNRSKMSYPEKIAYDWLSKNNINFVHQQKIGSYYPDFVVGNTIIEIDGEHWHNEELDAKKDLFFAEKGFIVVRIKSKEYIEQRLSLLFGV